MFKAVDIPCFVYMVRVMLYSIIKLPVTWSSTEEKNLDLDYFFNNL